MRANRLVRGKRGRGQDDNIQFNGHNMAPTQPLPKPTTHHHPFPAAGNNLPRPISNSPLHSMTFVGDARYMCIDMSEEAMEWRRLLDRARQLIASRPFALDDDGDDGGWPAPASTAMPPLDPAMFGGGGDDDDDDDDAKEWTIL